MADRQNMRRDVSVVGEPEKHFDCYFKGCGSSYPTEHGLRIHLGRIHSKCKRQRREFPKADGGNASACVGNDSDSDSDGEHRAAAPEQHHRRSRAASAPVATRRGRVERPTNIPLRRVGVSAAWSHGSDTSDAEDDFDLLSAGDSEHVALYSDSASSGRAHCNDNSSSESSASSCAHHPSRSSRSARSGASAAVPGVAGGPVGEAVAPGGALAGAPRPINTGMHSEPRVDGPAPQSLTWTQAVIYSWLYEYAANAPGDELLSYLKDPRCKLEELCKTADAGKKAVERVMVAAQPLFRLKRHRLTFRDCETRPPRPRWAKAEVVSRGLLSCLLSGPTNPRVYDWNRVFHYPTPTLPPGTAEEPYTAAACQRGCADAIARGKAIGWPEHLIVPYPFIVSEDGMSPDNVANITLGPVAVWPVCLPFELRRSLLAGEHVQLSPDLPVGKTRTTSLTRDHRRAGQEAFRFFVNEANELRRRGFLVHGSHIKNCPYPTALLLFMPFALGGAFDAVGAWIRLNAKYFHCFLCKADYYASWKRPSPDAMLSLARVEPAASHRQIFNDADAPALARRAAAQALDALHVNREVTAWDSLATVHMQGERCVYPDCFHCCELGTCKCSIFGVKLLFGDKCAVEGRAHSVSTAAAVADDFIAFGGHNSGYHVFPKIKDFSAVRQYTGMMVRSLLFSLLAVMCSISDLLNVTRQTALVNNLTAQILLLRHVNSRRWTSATPDNIDELYRFLEEHWDAAFGDFVNWERVKIHLTAHWRELYQELGTPVQWSTQHAIEALQRIIKNAWKHTNKINPSEQVLRRIAVLRFIHAVLLPSFGVHLDPVAALTEDRATQAFLSGAVEAVAGVSTVFLNPTTPAETTANSRLRSAFRDACLVCEDDDGEVRELPSSHVINPSRIYPRRAGFFSRVGLCAVSVPAYPPGACEGGERVHAIFSMFEQRAAAPAGAAAAGVGAVAQPGPAADGATSTVESIVERFFVEGWISYDVTGLSDADPNAPVAWPRLTATELNTRNRAVDIAVGRRMTVLSDISPPGLERDAAKKVFQLVKLSAKRELVDVASLCQPLLAYPYLGDVASARAYLRGATSKWEAEKWLVCPKLL